MIQVSELMELYKQFMSEPIEPTIDNERASLLFQTKWLRVLMMRERNSPDAISIDVEISFPLVAHSDLQDETTDALLQDIVLKTIKHLKYLLTLADHGYGLGIIGESCLWTASKRFTQPPTLEEFEVLLAFQN